MADATSRTSDLLSRVKSFLPQLELANQQLPQSDPATKSDHDNSNMKISEIQTLDEGLLELQEADGDTDDEDDASTSSSQGQSDDDAGIIRPIYTTTRTRPIPQTKGENTTVDKSAVTQEEASASQNGIAPESSVGETRGAAPTIQIQFVVGSLEENPAIEWLTNQQDEQPGQGPVVDAHDVDEVEQNDDIYNDDDEDDQDVKDSMSKKRTISRLLLPGSPSKTRRSNGPLITEL